MNTDVTFYNKETSTTLSFDYLDDLDNDYSLYPRRYHFLVRTYKIEDKPALMREVALAAYRYELKHCLKQEEEGFLDQILEPKAMEEECH